MSHSPKNSLLDRLPNCPLHGKFVGKECPLCDPAEKNVIPEPEAAEEKSETSTDRSSWHDGAEAELHEFFERSLGFYGASFIHARTDKKSTIKSGWPDFTCMKNGMVCCVEFKKRTGRTSQSQDECIAGLEADGIPCLVTGDFQEACDFVKSKLLITD